MTFERWYDDTWDTMTCKVRTGDDVGGLDMNNEVVKSMSKQSTESAENNSYMEFNTQAI